jgi:hypothetical protein
MRQVTVFAFLLLAAACNTTESGISKEKARSESDMLVASEYSLDDLRDIKVTVEDAPLHWTFTYQSVAQNTAGGPLFVSVDKRSGEVIKHGGSQ